MLFYDFYVALLTLKLLLTPVSFIQSEFFSFIWCISIQMRQISEHFLNRKYSNCFFNSPAIQDLSLLRQHSGLSSPLKLWTIQIITFYNFFTYLSDFFWHGQSVACPQIKRLITLFSKVYSLIQFYFDTSYIWNLINVERRIRWPKIWWIPEHSTMVLLHHHHVNAQIDLVYIRNLGKVTASSTF